MNAYISSHMVQLVAMQGCMIMPEITILIILPDAVLMIINPSNYTRLQSHFKPYLAPYTVYHFNMNLGIH